jgi:hypothetical protein
VRIASTDESLRALFSKERHARVHAADARLRGLFQFETGCASIAHDSKKARMAGL